MDEMTRPRGPIVAGLAIAVLAIFSTAASASAQDAKAGSTTSSPWFPSTLVVRPLIDGPTKIGIGGGPIFSRRDPPSGSGNRSPEADVAFGYRLPLYRWGGDRESADDDGTLVDLSIEAGLQARFALGQGHNGLINSDFRVALPLGARFGPRWEAILALAHVSSHLGDNLLEQEPTPELQRVSKNGLEGTVIYRIVGGLRGYWGVDWNLDHTRTEQFAARFGLDLDRPPELRGSPWPIGSIDFGITDLADRLSASAIAGVGFGTGAGELRLALRAHTGPAPMGQFRTVDETWFGLFLDLVPGVVAHSDR